MTSPTLRLVLDEPDRAHVARGHVRGRLEIESTAAWFGTVELAWVLRSTPSFGRERVGEHAREHLFAGEVKPGEPRVIELDLIAPGYPPSYDGETIRFAWELVAVAEDDGGNRVEARREITVVLPPDGGISVRCLEPGDPARVGQANAKPVVLTGLATVVCLGIGAAGLVTGSSFLSWFFGIWGALFLIAFALMFHGWRLVKRVGNVQIDVQRPQSTGYREAGGREADHVCTVWVRPSAKVESVAVELEVYEQVEGPQQSDGKRIENHTCWRATAELEMREPGTWRGTLPLPEPRTVPFSVGGGWMRILWRLTAQVKPADGDPVPFESRLVARPAQGPGAKT